MRKRKIRVWRLKKPGGYFRYYPKGYTYREGAHTRVRYSPTTHGNFHKRKGAYQGSTWERGHRVQ